MSQFRVCVLWRTRPSWSLKASPSETLLTTSVLVKCDGLAFGSFPGCVTRCFTLTSRFLLPRPAEVTIYATPFVSLSFFFFGQAKNLWICEATTDSSGASSKKRKRRIIWRSLQTGTDFAQHCVEQPSWNLKLRLHQKFGNLNSPVQTKCTVTTLEQLLQQQGFWYLSWNLINHCGT